MDAQQVGQMKISVNGREIMFPPLDLSMGEMCDAEQFFGADFSNIRRSAMRLTAAYLWVAIKRVDPTVTVEDIRELDPEVLKQLAEVDAGPPADAPDAKPTTSTESSPASSEGSGPDPSPIGGHGSATGSVSAQVTSVA